VTAGAILPLAAAGNIAGLEVLHSLAAVFLGGLISATLFTLVLLPAICANIDLGTDRPRLGGPWSIWRDTPP